MTMRMSPLIPEGVIEIAGVKVAARHQPCGCDLNCGDVFFDFEVVSLLPPSTRIGIVQESVFGSGALYSHEPRADARASAEQDGPGLAIELWSEEFDEFGVERVIARYVFRPPMATSFSPVDGW